MTVTHEIKKRDDSLTGKIIGAAIEVHRRLGAGLLESHMKLVFVMNCI